MMLLTALLFVAGIALLVYAALCQASEADDAAEKFRPTPEEEYAGEVPDAGS